MRVAIVSPYSWTYPGGVNRHVEALAGELIIAATRSACLLPGTRPAASAGRFIVAPEPREVPEYLVPLARTVGIGANGSVSNLCVFPDGIARLRRELRAFAPDVVHVHEPPGFLVGSDACTYRAAPVVGTFHAYSTKPLPNLTGAPAGRAGCSTSCARIAVSEAAAWTGRRWFGGSYEVIPNGVDTSACPPCRSRPRTGSRSCSSAERRSARACRCSSPPSRRWSSTCPRG